MQTSRYTGSGVVLLAAIVAAGVPVSGVQAAGGTLVSAAARPLAPSAATRVGTVTAAAALTAPTPLSPSVQVLSVGVYGLAQGHEHHLLRARLGSEVRLKIVVAVAHAPGTGVSLTATWALRGYLHGRTFYSDSHTFHLHDGVTGLYYDLILPAHNFATGAYHFAGSVTYHGVMQQRITTLHVIGQLINVVPMRVHYAHLRLTVPPNWHLVFQTTNGQPATGKNSLIMISNRGYSLVDVVSIQLHATPSAADLSSFPGELLRQEFPDGVSHVKTIFFEGQIDGHDVFAAQGDVVFGGKPSTAIAIATNKKREFYAFTIVNYLKKASPVEQHAALASVFGAKLD